MREPSEGLERVLRGPEKVSKWFQGRLENVSRGLKMVLRVPEERLKSAVRRDPRRS